MVFQNIVELLIEFCHYLTDISSLMSLSSLEYISLGYCDDVSDVSPLKDVLRVCFKNLCSVNNITSQLGSKKQKDVTFEFVDIVSDLSCLSCIQKLRIVTTREAGFDLSNLVAVQEVSIQLHRLEHPGVSPLNITGYNSFKNASVIHLGRCNVNSEHLSFFSKVVDPELRYCKEVNDLSCLWYVSSLLRIVLMSLPNIKDIFMLGPVRNIYVNDCPIESLRELGKVRNLFMIKCGELSSLKGIKSNSYVLLRSRLLNV
jgi:hypothetical protein